MSCNKKIISKKVAQSVIKNNKKESRQWRKEIRYYFCEECSGLHLTSKEEFAEPVKVKVRYLRKWNKLLRNCSPFSRENIVLKQEEEALKKIFLD